MRFFFGVIPDGVILSFTIEDDIDYIKKSILAIEALSNAKVFILALYAFKTEFDYVINSSKKRLIDNEVADVKAMVEGETGIPVVVSGDGDYDNIIFEKIIEYYCES